MDLALAAAVSFVPLLIGFLGWRLLGPLVIPVAISAAAFFITLAQLEISERRREDYRQIEALFSLFSVVKPSRPLPPMRDWVISPDLASIIVREVLDRKSSVILECGSGLSTLLMSYCVISNGKGHIWSLEHDAKYARLAEKLIDSHGMKQTSTVIHAPLKEVFLRGRSWLWYDSSILKDIGPIDIAVIDGPPKRVQRNARYPALPLIYRYLSEDAIVILDDASRKEGPHENLWVRKSHK